MQQIQKMNRYARLSGKRGKSYQEKRKKQMLRKHRKRDGANICTDGFMGLDYEDSVFIPEQQNDSKNGKNELGRSGQNHKKKSRFDMNVLNHFYEKEDSNQEEQDASDAEGNDSHERDSYKASSDNEVKGEDSEEEMTNDEEEPFFLLNYKDLHDDAPFFEPQQETSEIDRSTKNEHNTKKTFIKAQSRKIVQCFNLLLNNELLNSFSFIPFPSSMKHTREIINNYCNKFSLGMWTQEEKGWLSITIMKPKEWSITKMKKNKKQNRTNQNSMNRKVIKGKTEESTLMEGLSNPIGDENKGNLLLKKMGWTGGALGQQEEGITEPLGIAIKRDGLGIGATGRDLHGGNEMSFVRSKKD